MFGSVGHLGSASAPSPEWFDYLYCGGAVLLALALAALGLWGRELGGLPARTLDAASALVRPIQKLHTGRIGDYTAALSLGVGIFGGLMLLTLL